MRKMKDSGIEWIGQIPEDWTIRKVKDGFVRKNEKAHIEDPVVLSLARSGVKVRDLSNNDGQIAESYYDYNPVEPGDLLINPMDLYSGANCSISKVSGVISPAYMNLKNKEGFDASYYDYFFKTQYWSMALFAHGKGVSFDNRWTMNRETLFNYNIPYPTFEEQDSIATYLDTKCSEIDTIVRETEQTIEEYKKLKQSLITEVVTGKKRVADDGLSLSDEPREMKDSGVEWIREVPREWEIIRLKGLGNCQNGISKGAEYFGEDFEFPFVNYTDAYNNYEIPDPRGRANSTQEDRIRYSLKEGDVLFTRTSETIEEIGFASTCMKDIDNAVFSGFLIRFRPTTNNLFKGFSKYYFRSSHLRRYFVKEMNLVTRASLSQQLLKGMSVALPSIKEQKSIATYLDSKCSEIDRLISDKQRLLEELEIYKKSLIYECVTGKREIN